MDTFSTASTIPTSSGIATFMPLSQRLDQLEASIHEALGTTNGVTFYPQENTPEKADVMAPREEGMIATVDLLNNLMFQLNARLARIKEVTGASI